MPRIDRRIAVMVVFMVSIVLTGYYLNIVTFENSLGTQNTLEVSTGASTESSNDVLMEVSFAKGAENLSWNSIQLELNVDGATYPCMVGGLSSVAKDNGTVQSKLNADGKTFTINIDATIEDTQYIDLHSMSASNKTSYSLSVLTTTVLLEGNVTGVALEEDFNDVEFNSSYVLDESSEEKLDWYTYDFLNHHIIPDSEVYVIEDRGVWFKIQFLNYYNSDGQQRHYTLIVAPIGNSSIPALTDESMVQVTPCSIIEDGDGVWGAEEVISLQENGIDICEGECTVTIVALFEEKRIVGADSDYLFG